MLWWTLNGLWTQSPQQSGRPPNVYGPGPPNGLVDPPNSLVDPPTVCGPGPPNGLMEPLVKPGKGREISDFNGVQMVNLMSEE